jgi:hypothetical protein
LEPLELNAADLDGCVILPVAADNLVLLDAAVFEYREFRMPTLRNDFAGNFGFSGIRSGQKFLFIGSHGDHVAKGNGAAHFAGQGFHLDRIPGRNPVLLPTSSDHGVHRPSRRKSETLIIRMVSLLVNAQLVGVAGKSENALP